MPSTEDPDATIAGWTDALGSLDAHQHLVGNYLVTVAGDRAEATAAFQATHQFVGQTWTLGGDYVFELVRSGKAWQVGAMTMTAVWQTGDPTLLGRARESTRWWDRQCGHSRCSASNPLSPDRSALASPSSVINEVDLAIPRPGGRSGER